MHSDKSGYVKKVMFKYTDVWFLAASKIVIFYNC